MRLGKSSLMKNFYEIGLILMFIGLLLSAQNQKSLVVAENPEPLVYMSTPLVATWGPTVGKKVDVTWQSAVFRPQGTSLRVVVKISPTLQPPTYSFYIDDWELRLYSCDKVILASGHVSVYSWNFKDGSYTAEINLNLEATGYDCYLYLRSTYYFTGVDQYGHLADFEMWVYDTYSPPPATYSYKILVSGLLGGSTYVYLDNNALTTLSNNQAYDINGLTGSHTISVDSLVYYGSSTRYVCFQNSITVSSQGSYIFKYNAQYYLTVQLTPPNGGTVSPLSGWYDKGQQVTISASPSLGFVFRNWDGSGSGSYSGTNPTVVITINEPITQVARFELNVTLFMGLATIVAILVVSIVMFLKRKRPPPPPP